MLRYEQLLEIDGKPLNGLWNRKTIQWAAR